jgi:hypothetical protein
MERRLPVGAIDHVNQLAYDDCRLSAECTYDIDELDDAEPALTALVLGDERLRLGQALGDLRLSQTVAFAKVPQEGTQLLLARRAQGVSHGGRPRSKTAASAHNPSFGLSHFGIVVGLCRQNARSGREFDGGEGVR